MGASRGVPLDSPWSAGPSAAAAAAAADSLLPLGSMDVPVSNTNANPNANLGFFSADWSLPLLPSAVQVSLDENLDPFVRQFLLQQQQLATPFLPEPLWTSCQYSGFQPLYSPIPPPTASCDEADAYLMGVGYHHPAIPRDSFWQPQQLAWGSAGQPTPSAQLPPAVVNLHLNHAHYIDDAQPCSSGWPPPHPPQAPLHDTYPRQSLPPLPYDQPSSLFSLATALPCSSNNDSNTNNITPRLSCEKVGVWAHKAYVDLLASIHAQKRHHEGGSSAKTGLYPQPPRISGLKKNAFRPQLQSISSADAALPTRHGRAVAALDAPDRRKRMRASIGGEGGDGYHPDIGTSSSHGYPFPTPVEQFRRHSSATGHRRYMPICNITLSSSS